MNNPDQPAPSLTWTILLGRWTEFARSAVALPETGEAGRYRRAVPSLITLHAVTHALGELDLLDEDEQALAIDRAEILVRRESEALERTWAGEPLPEAVLVFVRDAESAIGRLCSGQACFEWLVTADGTVFDHPGVLLDAIAQAGLTMDLYVPSPGVPFFTGAVAVVVCCEHDESLEEAVLDAIGEFFGPDIDGPVQTRAARQVYRQFDFASGGPVRDLIAPMSASDTPGQPLLVPGLEAGEIRPVPLPPRSAAGVKLGVLPVVDADEVG